VVARATWIICSLVALFASGCAGSIRRDAPHVGEVDAVPVGFPNTVRISNDSRSAFEARSPKILEQIRTAAGGSPVNILALSGGGVGAAFGAGALVGWTRSATRPDFQVVTGVSAGALIAPFAFLGPGWDDKLADIFSGSRTQHLLQSHWTGVLFGASVYRGKPLFDLVDRYVTVDLLRAVAEEAAKGRLLMIATTDLDKEQTVIWNLGIIAAQGGESARRLFRDVIIASCSIPGLYPPVLIRVTQSGTLHDEMHVDGGTTSALFIAPELANLIPLDSARLEGANTFVIVNGPLGAPSQTTPLRTTSILERSIIATLHTSSLEGVELALALAQRAGMQLRITEIPNDYPYVGPLDVEPARMKALYDFGMRCAQQQQLWATAVELLDRVERARLTSAAAPTECPGPTQVQRAGD